MLIYKKNLSIEQWVTQVLTEIAPRNFNEIHLENIAIDFENKDEITNIILESIVKGHVVDDELRPNFIMVVGQDVLDLEVVASALISQTEVQKNYIIIPDYTHARAYFIDEQSLNKNPFFSELGNDEAFKQRYKFNWLLNQYYNQKILPPLIKKVLNLKGNIIASFDGSAEMLQEIYRHAKETQHDQLIVQIQINSNHLHNIINNSNIRFETALSPGLISDRQDAQTKFVAELKANSLLISSVNHNNPLYPHVPYQLSVSSNIENSLSDMVKKYLQLVDLEMLNKSYAFSAPYHSSHTIIKNKIKLNARAIPIFDQNYFQQIPTDVTHANLRSNLRLLPDRMLSHLLISYIYLNLSEAKLIAKDLLAELRNNHADRLDMLSTKIAVYYKEIETVLYLQLPSPKPNQYEFVNQYVTDHIQTFVQQDLDILFSDCFAKAKYLRLQKHDKNKVHANFVVGGCGCGKTTYNKYLTKIGDFAHSSDTLYLNVDDLFDILYASDSVADIIFSEWSFEETLILHDRIVNEIIHNNHQLPNLYYEGIYLINDLVSAYSESQWKIVSLSVPLETAIYRVYQREKGLRNPLGSCFVINTYRKNVQLTLALMELFSGKQAVNGEMLLLNTEFNLAKNEKPHKIALFDFTNRKIEIYHFGLFIRYFASLDANTLAVNYYEVFSGLDLNTVFNKILLKLAKFTIHFFDPIHGEVYLVIQNGVMTVLENFLFQINIAPWQLSLLNKNTPDSMAKVILQVIYQLEKSIAVLKPFLMKGDQIILAELLSNLKIAFENHRVTDDSVIHLLRESHGKVNYNAMKELLDGLAQVVHANLIKLTALKNNIIEASKIEDRVPLELHPSRIDTTLYRYYESDFSMKLIENPPNNLMKVVAQVSLRIIASINLNLNKNNDHQFAYFLNRLHCSHAAYGRFNHVPTLTEVQTLLTENKPNQLAKILFTHFVFIDVCYRHFEHFDIQENDYTGTFGQIWNPNNIRYDSNSQIRSMEHDDLYGSDLFKDRFRINRTSNKPIFKFDFFHENNAMSNQHGIMIHSQSTQFGVADHHWHQDRFFSETRVSKSVMSADMFRAEIPYVSGVSGMATLMIPCALLIGKVNSLEEFAYYLLATASYLAHGGLHSWHEVFAIAQYRLNLLGQYQVNGTQIGNFNLIFKILDTDVELKKMRAQIWIDLRHFYLAYTHQSLAEILIQRPYFDMDPQEFLKMITDYDHDRLALKLCQLQSIKINVSLIQKFAQLVLLTAKIQKTAKGIADIDIWLKTVVNPLFNYVDKFNYSPIYIWSELNSFMQQQHKIYSDCESRTKMFTYANQKQATLLTIHGLLPHLTYKSNLENNKQNDPTCRI